MDEDMRTGENLNPAPTSVTGQVEDARIPQVEKSAASKMPAPHAADADPNKAIKTRLTVIIILTAVTLAVVIFTCVFTIVGNVSRTPSGGFGERGAMEQGQFPGNSSSSGSGNTGTNSGSGTNNSSTGSSNSGAATGSSSNSTGTTGTSSYSMA
jgi:hypothetical protein